MTTTVKQTKKLSELTIQQQASFLRQLRTEMTHHSNAMEGISLTYGETKDLLEKGITANSKPLSEQLVVLGFADAFDEVVLSATRQVPLTSSVIKDLHASLFSKALQICPDKVERPIGAYRTDEKYITGLDKALANPRQIDNLIENLLYSSTPSDWLGIAKFHIDFELIHPFADGNGRVGRLIIAYQAFENDLIPPLIRNEHRDDYLAALSEPSKLADFLIEAESRSLELIFPSTALELDDELERR